jgi:MFS family permease
MATRFSEAGALSSLRNDGFRRYFFGQMASMSGSWAQTVAMAWLVLRLTGSGAEVGTVTAVQFTPVVLLSAWAGALADRFDERRSVLAVQTLLGTQAVILTVVVATDVVEMWMIYGLALLQGIGLAFDTPTRQSLVGRVVGDGDLHNALSLNAALVQVARVVGPAVAGILIETVGISICFGINAASYALVAAAVFTIHAPRRDRTAPGQTPARVLDGLRLVQRTPELRNVLVLALVSGLVAVNFTVGLPVLVRDQHGDDAGLFGALLAVHGLGALVGAALSAARQAPTKLLVFGCYWALAASLAAVAVANATVALGAAIGLAGLSGLTLGVTLNASLQLGAPPAFRGRVIGLYFMVVFGSNVVAAPVIGAAAQAWGAEVSFGASAALVAMFALVLSIGWRRRLGEAIVLAPASATHGSPISDIRS